MFAIFGLFMVLWLIGCIVSTCIVPFVGSIVGIRDEKEIVTSIVVLGFFLALIAMAKIMGG